MDYINSPKLVQCFRGGFEKRPGWWFKVAFDGDFVKLFKSQIPMSARTWDGGRSHWWISDEYAETLLVILPSFAQYLNQPRLM